MTTLTRRSGDVVVVGAGIVGSSVAYHLSRKGVKVLLVDKGQVGGGTSSANPGVISLVTKNPGQSLELALLSHRRYASLGDELDRDIEYERSGALIAAETESEMEYLQDLSSRQRAAGAPVEVVDRLETQRLHPFLSDVVLGGTYCAQDAHLNPLELTRGYADGASRMGADTLLGTEVMAIRLDKGSVRSVITTAGSITTQWVVNCSGAAARDVGSMVGAAHEVIPRLGHQIAISPGLELPPVKIVTARQMLAKHLGRFEAGAASFGYTRKLRSGLVILGTTNTPVPDFAGGSAVNRGISTSTDLPHRASPELASVDPTSAILAEVRRYMPALADFPVVRSFAGIRPFSSTGPLLGRIDSYPCGYLVASGHGGDGVSLADVTGRYIASLVCESTPPTWGEFVAEQVAINEAEEPFMNGVPKIRAEEKA